MRQDYFFVRTKTGEYETAGTPLFINCAGCAEIERAGETVLPAGRRDYTYYYLTKGVLELSFSGAPYRAVPPGAVIVIPPATPFAYRHAGEVVIWWAHFTGSYVKELLRGNDVPDGPCVLPSPASAEAMRVFQQFLDEMRALPDRCAEMRAAAAFLLTVTRITELRRGEERERRLSVSVDYIHRHYTEEIGKETLAAMENLSLSRYNLLFRRQTGHSPAQYVTELRMALARQLLTDRTTPISEVARLCGYDDPYYFSRCFRRETGMSPRDYRTGKKSGTVSKNSPATASTQATS